MRNNGIGGIIIISRLYVAPGAYALARYGAVILAVLSSLRAHDARQQHGDSINARHHCQTRVANISAKRRSYLGARSRIMAAGENRSSGVIAGETGWRNWRQHGISMSGSKQRNGMAGVTSTSALRKQRQLAATRGSALAARGIAYGAPLNIKAAASK